MSDFKEIKTQEELDTVLKEKLAKYEGYLSPEDVKKKYEGYLSPEAVKKQYEGYLSPEAVKKQYEGYLSPEEAAKKDAQIKGYETESVKAKVAHETGLSYDAVAFLSGADENAIRKSAETLKGLMAGGITAPLASTETGAVNAADAALKNTLSGLRGE